MNRSSSRPRCSSSIREECIDCGACVPACPVSAIYDSPDATPASQKELIEANAVYRAGDPAAVAAATTIVSAHVSAHPELINIPAAERAAAHQSSGRPEGSAAMQPRQIAVVFD